MDIVLGCAMLWLWIFFVPYLRRKSAEVFGLKTFWEIACSEEQPRIGEDTRGGIWIGKFQFSIYHEEDGRKEVAILMTRYGGSLRVTIGWEEGYVSGWRVNGREMPPMGFKEKCQAADILRAIHKTLEEYRRS